MSEATLCSALAAPDPCESNLRRLLSAGAAVHKCCFLWCFRNSGADPPLMHPRLPFATFWRPQTPAKATFEGCFRRARWCKFSVKNNKVVVLSMGVPLQILLMLRAATTAMRLCNLYTLGSTQGFSKGENCSMECKHCVLHHRREKYNMRVANNTLKGFSTKLPETKRHISLTN